MGESKHPEGRPSKHGLPRAKPVFPILSLNPHRPVRGEKSLALSGVHWLRLHRLGSAVETMWKGWAGLQPFTHGILGPMLALPPFRGRKNLALPDEKIPFVIGAQVQRARWQQLWRASTPSALPSRGQVREQLTETVGSFLSSLVLRQAAHGLSPRLASKPTCNPCPSLISMG